MFKQNSLKVGTRELTITYKEKTTKVEYTVSEDAAALLNTISQNLLKKVIQLLVLKLPLLIIFIQTLQKLFGQMNKKPKKNLFSCHFSPFLELEINLILNFKTRVHP